MGSAKEAGAAAPAAPPTYEAATTSSKPSGSNSTHLSPNAPQGEFDGISDAHRKSMEDEARELPIGWVRQYDNKSKHHFYVDTIADPPRSIWHHPYDDEEFMKTLAPHERERIQNMARPVIPEGAEHSSGYTDDENHTHQSSYPTELPPRPDGSHEKHTLGRKLKDKLTHSTHEEREAKRAAEAEAERKAYERHQKIRAAMQKAAETGEPQLIGKDRDGKDVYIEPPYGPGEGYDGYTDGSYGYNPYSSGVYSNPNARYIRPSQPYSRGYGYGGGYGGYGGYGYGGYGYGGYGGFGYNPFLGAGLGLGGGLLLGGLLL